MYKWIIYNDHLYIQTLSTCLVVNNNRLFSVEEFREYPLCINDVLNIRSKYSIYLNHLIQ